MFKFDKVNELLTYLWLVVVHYATGLISLINIIALKLIPDFNTRSRGDISDTIDDATYNGISLSLPSG